MCRIPAVYTVRFCTKRFKNKDVWGQPGLSSGISQQFFPNLHHIAGTHGQHQVSGGTVLQKIGFNFIKGGEILTGSSRFLEKLQNISGGNPPISPLYWKRRSVPVKEASPRRITSVSRPSKTPRAMEARALDTLWIPGTCRWNSPRELPFLRQVKVAKPFSS